MVAGVTTTDRRGDQAPVINYMAFPGLGRTAEDIRQSVCLHFGITLEEFLSTSRERRVCYPRQTFVYLMRTITPRSLRLGDVELARLINRDRSSVFHCEHVIRELITVDKTVRRQVDELRRSLLYENDITTAVCHD